MRKTWDEYFMDLATTASSRSTCPARQVGCVIVDYNNNVVSTGYNGSRAGEPHCDDVGCIEVEGACKRTIHAERNAIHRSTRAQRRQAHLYVTDLPCLDCAKRISKSGIIEVIYVRPYLRTQTAVLKLFLLEGIVVRTLEKKVDPYWKVFLQKINPL